MYKREAEKCMINEGVKSCENARQEISAKREDKNSRKRIKGDGTIGNSSS